MIEPDGQFLRNQDWIVKHNLCKIENLIRAATNLTKKLKNLKTSNLWTNHEQFLPKEFLSSWRWLVEWTVYNSIFIFTKILKFSHFVTSRRRWAGRALRCSQSAKLNFEWLWWSAHMGPEVQNSFKEVARGAQYNFFQLNVIFSGPGPPKSWGTYFHVKMKNN